MTFNTQPWTEKGSANNDTAVATRTGEAGRTHYITAITGSYEGSKSGLLQVKDGSTVIYEFIVYDTESIVFPRPIQATKGNAVTVELAASGGAGNSGLVNIQGITL